MIQVALGGVVVVVEVASMIGPVSVSKFTQESRYSSWLSFIVVPMRVAWLMVTRSLSVASWRTDCMTRTVIVVVVVGADRAEVCSLIGITEWRRGWKDSESAI